MDAKEAARQAAYQLDLTFDALRAGAAPWTFDERHLAKLRAHYEPGFAATADDWPAAARKVLRIARYQGALAALLAEGLNHAGLPADLKVPEECLLIASAVVKIACPDKPAGGAIGTEGPRCPLVSLAGLGAEGARIGAMFKGIVPQGGLV